jgi:AcrR family transcriptional regulator
MNESTAVRAIIQALVEEEGPLAPKKRLLVEAAILSFAEIGYSGTSTRMIADRAGVAEATIFRHFGTKKALLMRISAPVIKRLLAPAATIEMQSLLRKSGDDVRGFMSVIMLSRLAFADEYAPFVRILIQELPINSELQDLVKDDAAGLFKTVFFPALEHFKRAGKLKNIPPDRILRMIMSLLAGYYINREILAPGDWDDASEIDAMIDLVMQGVGLRDDPQRRMQNQTC